MLETLEDSGVLPLLEMLGRSGARPHVCAGAVRDVYFCLERDGRKIKPRDIDVVTFSIRQERLNEIAVSCGATANRYGGYSFSSSNGPSIDVWTAESTCGVVAWGAAPTLRNVLRSFVLNLNAVAFDFTTSRFFDWGCVRAIRQSRLAFVDDVLMHDQDIFAAKALISATRFQLAPTHGVVRLVKLYSVDSTIRHELRKTRTRLCPTLNVRSLRENFLSHSGRARKWVSKNSI